MPRKGENIRKRKDGRWEGRFKKGNTENGKTNYCSVYGKSYREVKNKLQIAKYLIETGDCSNTKDKSFSEIINLWEERNRIRLKGASQKKYDYLIKTHILPELGGLNISQITSTEINSFLNKKLNNGRLDGNGGLSPSYVKDITNIINSAVKFAVDERMCKPLSTPIYKPKIKKNEIKVLSEEEQRRIEEFIRENPTSTGIGILLTLYTGLRIGEICALSWKDIDFDNKIIHVRHTVARINNSGEYGNAESNLIIDEPKTKSSKRDIPMSSSVFPMLSKYREKSLSKYVVSETDDFTSPRTYEYRYHRILEKAGVASVNYHVLRHTFATRCISVGVDVKSLSEILGHGNSEITLNTYVHSSLDLKRSQLDKLLSVASC